MPTTTTTTTTPMMKLDAKGPVQSSPVRDKSSTMVNHIFEMNEEIKPFFGLYQIELQEGFEINVNEL